MKCVVAQASCFSRLVTNTGHKEFALETILAILSRLEHKWLKIYPALFNLFFLLFKERVTYLSPTQSIKNDRKRNFLENITTISFYNFLSMRDYLTTPR